MVNAKKRGTTKIRVVLIISLIILAQFDLAGLLLEKFGLSNSTTSIIANEAKAATGDVILLWDTASGTVPSGWTCISCSASDPFYGVFPRASSTYAVASSSADTHLHNLSYSSASNGASGLAKGNAGAVISVDNHTHTWGNPTVSSGNVLPPYKNLNFIKAATTSLPNNIIGIFATSTLPSGWTRYGSLDNQYLRGFSNNTAGGSASHSHDTTDTVTSGSHTATVADSGAGANSANSHTHAISPATGAFNASNSPPYLNVVFAYNSSGGQVSLPDGIHAIFDATPPTDWSTVSDQSPWSGNFIRGSSTYGTSGGDASSTHNHAGTKIFTSGTPSSNSGNRGTTGTFTGVTNTHTHDITYAVSSQSAWPTYRDVIIGKYVAPQQLTVSKTAASQTAGLSSGNINQYAHTAGCNNSTTCSAFTLTLNKGTTTLSSFKITGIGSVNENSDLSNAVLFYDSDGNASNGFSGQYGATSSSFSSLAATFNSSLELTVGTTYYFYLKFDLKSGTPTYPAGGQTMDFEVSTAGDIQLTTGTTTGTFPVGLNGAITVLPQITGYENSNDSSLNYAASCLSCGARIGPASAYRQSVIIAGYGFGADPGSGNRDTANNKVEIVGSSTTVLTDDGSVDTNVSAWSNTSITIRTDTTITGNADSDWSANFGGAESLKITASSSSSNLLNFYLLPQITSVTAPTAVANAAREYNSADGDGIITLNGTRFGSSSTGGWVRLLGCDAATCASPSGSATTTAWSNTAVTVQVPTVIADNNYSGSIVMLQGAGVNQKGSSTFSGFRILPRITGLNPASAEIGDPITFNGDHFCQFNNGSCPGAFNSTSTVVFYNMATSTAFTSWSDTAIVTAVATSGAIATGNATTTSDGFSSNGKLFTLNGSAPNDPSSLNQFRDSGLTEAISVEAYASSTPTYFTLTMSSGGTGGTLYPQIEIKPVGAPFACSGGACTAAIEGNGIAGAGPVDCSSPANNCSIASSTVEGNFHWQARVRRNKNEINYYSNWISFGGNADPDDIDFITDTVAPVITNIASTTANNSATITWDTDSEQSTSQVQYNTDNVFNDDCSINNDCSLIDPAYVTNHSVDLSSLYADTLYYFRVRSRDQANNETVSATSTFKTTVNLIPISGNLISLVFDVASSSDGPAYNSIMWKGQLAPGNRGKVRFQLAASTATSGPWSFVGGDTCSSGDWYDPGAPDVPAEIGCFEHFNNQRYFKYKIQLCSDDCVSVGSSTPRVDDIIINFSP